MRACAHFRRLLAAALIVCVAGCLRAAAAPAADATPAAPTPTLTLYNEFVRCDQHGTPLTIDTRDPALLKPIDTTQPIRVARDGYASFHLVVSGLKPGEKYALSAAVVYPQYGGAGQPLAGAAAVDLYTEWYHALKVKDKPDEVIPDGLVPYAQNEEAIQIPNSAMAVPDQTAQAFWVDAWIPATLPMHAPGFHVSIGLYRYPMIPSSPNQAVAYVKLPLQIAAAVIPKADAIEADHNCYGLGFVNTCVEPWPAEVQKDHPWHDSPEFFSVIHAFHRMAFDHRCIFHQLGTNHVGGFSPEFNPEIAGSGRDIHVVSWKLFDAHYGPLCDGSAMQGCRRAVTYEPRPVPTVYTAITPEWPAPFLHWGTPAYQVEFTKIVRAMHDHFAEKNWTHTNFELFFNHKMRYKGFPWDGDEERFSGSDAFFQEYGRLLKAALPLPATPPAEGRDLYVSKDGVRFIFRADASWNVNAQSQTCQGVINMWNVGGGCMTFYPKAFAAMKARGDIVWFYGGTPDIAAPAAAIVTMPARAYLVGFDGYCRWLVTSNGGDPWNHSTGGGELLYYPGGARGVHGPLPCIRLQLERNALQDVALLKSVEAQAGGHEAFATKLLALAKLTPDCFWAPDAALLKKPIIDWDNADIGEACAQGLATHKNLDLAAWWMEVRAAAMGAGEKKE